MATLDSVRRSLSSSSWLGIAVVGAAVFFLGIYTPALKGFPYTFGLEIALAVAGGALTVLGLSFWWDQREEERRFPPRRLLTGRAREVAIAPSLEVYRPDTAGRPPRQPESSGEGEPP